MKDMWQIVGLVILLSFLMFACDPKGFGERVNLFIDAASGESSEADKGKGD